MLDKYSWAVCSNMCIDENLVWFISMYYQLLLEVDINSGKVKCILPIPDCVGKKEFAYRLLAKIDDHLFLIPHHTGHTIIDYDLISKEYSYIIIPEENFKKGEELSFFYNCFVDEKKIVMFGTHPLVLIYDTESNSFISYRNWSKSISDKHRDNWLINGWTYVEGILTVMIFHSDKVLRLDINTGDFEIISTGLHQLGCYDMEYDGDSYWFSPDYLGGKPIKWNIVGNEKAQYINIPCMKSSDSPDESYKGGLLVNVNKHMWLIPTYDKDVNIYELNGNDKFEINKLPTIQQEKIRNFVMSNYHSKTKDSNGVIWTIHIDTCKLVAINSKTGEINIKQMYLDKILEKKLCSLLLNLVYKDNDILYESVDFYLSGFLNGL